jgi:hypothetical protein
MLCKVIIWDRFRSSVGIQLVTNRSSSKANILTYKTKLVNKKPPKRMKYKEYSFTLCPGKAVQKWSSISARSMARERL